MVDEAQDYAEGIATYGESISEKIESQTAIVNVLEVILGTEYARNMTATEHLQNEYNQFSPAAESELDAIDDLLEAIAVTRQFFKTLSLPAGLRSTLPCGRVQWPRSPRRQRRNGPHLPA
ncbi:hypothetical protein ACFQJD_08840 [Haloplanus sp. GCM10025708]|uniref:hypothetical protein n=1 Tax=Haloferacaceae TaxID=1644056 RepID=UPI00361BFF62